MYIYFSALSVCALSVSLSIYDDDLPTYLPFLFRSLFMLSVVHLPYFVQSGGEAGGVARGKKSFK